MTQRDLAKRAGTSQATLSAYERGAKAPSLVVAERIVEAAGYRLDLVTQVHFTQHEARGLEAFWVPDLLWRGKLPECFATVSMRDPAYLRGVARFPLRRRSSRRRLYESPLRRGMPDELIDWVDGALLVDLWDDMKLPKPIRTAWQPAVELAGKGPFAMPGYRGHWTFGLQTPGPKGQN